MSTRITRRFLEWRYWLATGAIIAVLAVTAAVGWYFLQQMKNNARYAAAFIELAETAGDVDRALLRLRFSLPEAAGAAAGPAQDTALRDARALRHANHALAVIYTAIRQSDPDGAKEEEFGEEVDADRALIAGFTDLDVAAASAEYQLAWRGMPSALAAVWEAEDDEPTPTTAETGLYTGELEEEMGEFLLISIAVENALSQETGPDIAAALVEVDRASDLFDDAVRAGLDAIAAAIRESSEDSTTLAFTLLLIGTLACVLAALGNAVFLFRPMATSVIEKQDALERERDRAVASSQAKKDFLAVMSHELRTPLNGILGFSNLTLQTALSPSQRDYVETIQSSGEGLLGLLNDILDLSKIEAGSVVVDPHPFCIAETVDSAVALMSAKAQEKGLELNVFIDPDLPTSLLGDSSLIRKLVLNLVGNAVKFTERGGVAVSVRPAAAPIEGVDAPIEIDVQDTGVGIPEDKRQTIFDRFSQVDASTRRSFEGTGLGLAICREIATVMQGSLSVDSTVGRGSTFQAQLGLNHVTPRAETMRASIGVDLAGARILVIDDNPLNRRLATAQLTAYGADIRSAATAEEALGALTQAEVAGAPFRVAIIDHMMPTTDGVALLRLIRTMPRLRQLKTVLCSSGGVRSDEAAQELGFDACAPKPVRQEALASSLAALLAGPPIVVPADDAAGAATAQPDTPAHGGGGISADAPEDPAVQRLLLVDDNAANLKLAHLILSGAGYAVDQAKNGVEAVDAVGRTRYAAILMDIRMPVMDGLEATQRIRRMPDAIARTPIIAMTADIAANDEAALIEAGLDGVVPKPIDDATLLRTLERHILEPAPSDG